MGSWSVSCGISNIAITAGNECVIIPLRKESTEYGGYVPTSLPIYGEYNDYGGMENIVKDANTDLIEKHLGITIDEFVKFLVDGKFTYNRSEVNLIIKKLEDNNRLDEVKDWRFMWVDKQVYDFMSISLDTWEKGKFNFGYHKILDRFGFTKIENGKLDNSQPQRFKHRYEKDGVAVYSDGHTLFSDTYVYRLVGGESHCLDSLIEIPSDLMYLKDLTDVEAWDLMGTIEIGNTFKCLFKGGGHQEFGTSLNDLLFERLNDEQKAKMLIEIDENKRLYERYFDNLDSFGNDLAKLSIVKHNLHPMSGRLSPHVLHLTPQCGEHSIHQTILEKFVEINKGYVYDEDEDE